MNHLEWRLCLCSTSRADWEQPLNGTGAANRNSWRYIALTSPYFEEAYFVGSPTPSSPPKLKGKEVAVRKGDALAAKLQNRGARPIRIDDLTKFNGLVAASEWQLEQMNLTPVGEELDSVKHVIALPPGENAFLKRLDQFLLTKRSDIKTLLQHEVSQR